ncbi:MAG: NADH-quinone oxidoreductase subunit J [Gemmataceae bacterium]
MTLHAILFYLLAALTGISAVAVVVSQNIIRAATWLLFTLAGTAGIFFLLGADFIGATQLLVYVGGTLVLVVFGVMLTAQGPYGALRISAAEWAISLTVGLFLYGVLALSLLTVDPPIDTTVNLDDRPPPGQPGRSLLPSRHLGAAFLGDKHSTPDAFLQGPGHLGGYPRTRMHYLLPFEIISVHLLVVLIGAAYLARAKRRRAEQS